MEVHQKDGKEKIDGINVYYLIPIILSTILLFSLFSLLLIFHWTEIA